MPDAQVQSERGLTLEVRVPDLEEEVADVRSEVVELLQRWCPVRSGDVCDKRRIRAEVGLKTDRGRHTGEVSIPHLRGLDTASLGVATLRPRVDRVGVSLHATTELQPVGDQSRALHTRTRRTPSGRWAGQVPLRRSPHSGGPWSRPRMCQRARPSDAGRTRLARRRSGC